MVGVAVGADNNQRDDNNTQQKRRRQNSTQSRLPLRCNQYTHDSRQSDETNPKGSDSKKWSIRSVCTSSHVDWQCVLWHCQGVHRIVLVGMCICKFCSWYILYSGFWSLPASPFALPCGGFCASGARALFSFSFFASSCFSMCWRWSFGRSRVCLDACNKMFALLKDVYIAVQIPKRSL